MANMTSSQRRQLLENAEGFLELASIDDQEIPLSLETKIRLADRALTCLDQIQKPMGHKPYLLYLKGHASRLAERHVEALHYLEQALRIDSDNFHLYFALAWSYKRTGQITDAIESMQRAVELNSESDIAHYNLACYYALDEQLESALMHLSYAFELNAEYREMAIFESDFDLIRSDPRFATMTSVVV